MVFNDLTKIELEITNYCNAKCPGCARTQYIDRVKPQHLSFEQIKRNFPIKHIKGKKFKLCGVIGEPMMHPDCLKIVRYFTDNGGNVEISTNGSCGSRLLWKCLAEICSSTGLIYVNFCIDGFKETNHIYRVNTNYDDIDERMQLYSDNNGIGSWVYIVFDHNEYELQLAKDRAKELNLSFMLRTGMRNSFNKWITNDKVITTTKEHSKIREYEELLNTKDLQYIVDTINCKFYNDHEIFIASNNTMWSCCFIWDSVFKGDMKFNLDTNDLNKYSIDELLDSEYFKYQIKEWWNINEPNHCRRCLITCGKNRIYQNEIVEMKNEST